MSETGIIDMIRQRRPFGARLDNGAFELRVDRYRPVLATAVHDGHRVAAALARKMAVGELERRFEEDPHTGRLAAGFEIWLAGLESRYCYDLNRGPEACIYQEAWGARVWRTPPDEAERAALVERHASYYRVLGALLTVLVEDFGAALLYDLHSYNQHRHSPAAPLFNIGTHYIDREAHGRVLDQLLGELGRIEVDGRQGRAALDEVFQGRGYQAEFVRRHHPRVLCVPLEIGKVFMDAAGQHLRSGPFERLRADLGAALARTAAVFEEAIEPGREQR